MFARILAISLAVAGCSVASAADETYDLRGPAPMKGQKSRDVLTFTMKKASISLDLGNDVKFDGKVDMTTVTETEDEILAVDGRKVTKLRTKIIKDEAKRKTTIAGDTTDETDKKALVGEIVFSELTKDGWKHSLEDATPSDKQKKELKDFDNPESDDDLYPAEKIKVGHEWNIDPSAFKKVLGSNISDAKGTGKAKFLRIEKYADEECAVLEMDLDVTAKLKQEDSLLDVAIKGKVKIYRSIASAIDLKFNIDGTAKFSGTVEEDGMKVNMTFGGKMVGEGTSKVIKK